MAPNRIGATQPHKPDATHHRQPLPAAPELKRFLRSIINNPKTLALLVEEHKAPVHVILVWIKQARLSGYRVLAHMSNPTTYEFVPPS